MRFTTGQQAPAFACEDIHGRPLSLETFANKKLLLCFYRYAGCPLCNYYLSILIGRYQYFESHDLNVVVVFQSPQKHVLEYPDQQHPPFPLVADPHKELSSLFGVESSVMSILKPQTVQGFYTARQQHNFPQEAIDGDFFLLPAEFLIGPPNFTIYAAHYWKNLADPIPSQTIEQFLTASDTMIPIELRDRSL